MKKSTAFLLAFACLLIGCFGSYVILTEFLPVSSSGHILIFERILNVNTNGADMFLGIVLHAGTLFAVIAVYFKKLISLISTSENKYYKITEDGEEMLASLANLIPGFLLKRINTKINAIQKKLEQKTVIWADYTPISDDSFIVDCKISENDQILINLSLNVPTKEQAIHICNKWYENPSRYYADIIKIFG